MEGKVRGAFWCPDQHRQCLTVCSWRHRCHIYQPVWRSLSAWIQSDCGYLSSLTCLFLLCNSVYILLQVSRVATADLQLRSYHIPKVPLLPLCRRPGFNSFFLLFPAFVSSRWLSLVRNSLAPVLLLLRSASWLWFSLDTIPPPSSI
jgi:hypothetical protein